LRCVHSFLLVLPFLSAILPFLFVIFLLLPSFGFLLVLLLLTLLLSFSTPWTIFPVLSPFLFSFASFFAFQTFPFVGSCFLSLSILVISLLLLLSIFATFLVLCHLPLSLARICLPRQPG